jgi:hypothetical protein
MVVREEATLEKNRQGHLTMNSKKQLCWEDLLPEFAPLPAPFVKLLFTNPERFHFSDFFSGPNASFLDRFWTNIQGLRGDVFGYVHTAVQAERSGALDTQLSIAWFLNAVKAFDLLHHDASRQKAANWQERHLLRTRSFGVPEPNSASALLMMRALSSQRRHWLPSLLDSDEPWFWVWGQQPGETEPRMYPFPLPSHIPANTLLWTSWPGAAWLPGWHMVREYGALAWAKTVQVRGQTFWHLSVEDLAAWDRDFVERSQLERQPPTALPGLQAAYGLNKEPYVMAKLHAAADHLLFELGEARLFETLTYYYSKRPFPSFMCSARTDLVQ